MKTFRKPTDPELKLLEFLIANAKSIELSSTWMNDLLVRSMDDGGMGSILLFPGGVVNESRLFGNQVSDCVFTDEDGVKVLAALNVDSCGELFEIDIWKVDSSPLIRIPDVGAMDANVYASDVSLSRPAVPGIKKGTPEKLPAVIGRRIPRHQGCR